MKDTRQKKEFDTIASTQGSSTELLAAVYNVQESVESPHSTSTTQYPLNVDRSNETNSDEQVQTARKPKRTIKRLIVKDEFE